MKALVVALAALLVGTAAQAQPAKRIDCSKAANPAACEERQVRAEERAQRMRDAHKNAAEICKTRPSAEQRECMRVQMCQQANDPARCEDNARKNAERRDKVLAACKGKQGAVLNQCMRDEFKKLPPQK